MLSNLRRQAASVLRCVRAEMTGLFPFTGDMVEGTDLRELPYRATGSCYPSRDRQPV